MLTNESIVAVAFAFSALSFKASKSFFRSLLPSAMIPQAVMLSTRQASQNVMLPVLLHAKSLPMHFNCEGLCMPCMTDHDSWWQSLHSECPN